MNKKYLKAQEVADRLEVGRRTVINYAREHSIGANIGGSVGFRFTEEDVAELLEAMGHKAAS